MFGRECPRERDRRIDSMRRTARHCTSPVTGVDRRAKNRALQIFPASIAAMCSTVAAVATFRSHWACESSLVAAHEATFSRPQHEAAGVSSASSERKNAAIDS